MTGNEDIRIAAVIVAAGRGTRAGGETPKQWRPLAGRRVIDWTLEAFRKNTLIGDLVVVLHPDDLALLDAPDVIAVPGGATRRDSVLAGLEALEGRGCEAVLIHDAARATVPDAVITAVAEMLRDHDGAAAGIAVSDALWRADGGSATVSGTAGRDNLFRAQTPQGFRFDAILAAHRAFTGPADDDVAVARAAGIEVVIAPGHPDNIKITTPGDFARAERILKGRQTMDIRVGNGFDVHRFGPGDHVTLCGVMVPHTHGLDGHSDADVGMHAITDAIYGALAEGDIGRHFPPSDPQWKGADSRIFLDHAVKLAAERGFAVANVDCTLICEAPKIGPHAADMQAALAGIIGIGADRVSVKATTSERLGFTGRGEGIAALATATLKGA